MMKILFNVNHMSKEQFIITVSSMHVLSQMKHNIFSEIIEFDNFI